MAVTAALLTGRRAWPLGTLLYLPRSWTDAPARRQAARIPMRQRFQEKWRLALTLWRQSRASGLTFTAVVADAEYGDNATLRRTFHRAKLPYAFGISPTVTVFRGSPTVCVDPRQPRPRNRRAGWPDQDPVSVRALSDALPVRAWRPVSWRNGANPPWAADFAAVRVTPVSEPVAESARIKPSSPYATSKAAFDFHLRAISRHQAFPALIVMPSNGYCEGQTVNRIIPKTIICALNGKKLQLQGGGVARKSYLHGDDISRAIILCMERGSIGEVYNVGPPLPMAISEVVGLLADMMGKSILDVAEIAPDRTGQDACYWLDSYKIKKLGWEQKVFRAEGFQRMIDWVKKYPELLEMDSTYRHRP